MYYDHFSQKLFIAVQVADTLACQLLRCVEAMGMRGTWANCLRGQTWCHQKVTARYKRDQLAFGNFLSKFTSLSCSISSYIIYIASNSHCHTSKLEASGEVIGQLEATQFVRQWRLCVCYESFMLQRPTMCADACCRRYRRTLFIMSRRTLMLLQRTIRHRIIPRVSMNAA